MKVKSCPKLHQILDVFALPNFKEGSAPQKLYIIDNAQLAARHVAKLWGPPTPRVIGANSLNF